MNTAQKLVAKVNNPFASPEKANGQNQAASSMLSNQAITSVQGAIAMARQFPRNQADAMNRILDACTRYSLAQEAEYAFPRGGQSVTGPSIRLAEVLAQNWGNIDFGIIELSNEGGRSQVMTYAWDLETNVRQQKVFVAEHIRHTRKGSQVLTDPRDVYEMTANLGARRLRACILGILPKDVIESAVEQCQLTLANNMGAPSEAIQGLVDAFGKYGVTDNMIAKRLGKSLKAITSAEVIRMRQIYASLRDGMSKPADWFDFDDEPGPGNGNGNGAKSAGSLASALKDKLAPQVPDQTDIEKQIAEHGYFQTDDGFINAHGVAFDPDEHAKNADGLPITNMDGSFRKKRRSADPEDDVLTPPGPPPADFDDNSDQDLPW